MPTPPVKIRPASPNDVPAVIALLAEYVRQGLVLPRREQEIAAPNNPFILLEQAQEIIGCVSLRTYSRDLVEIRSLAVRPDRAGAGFGSRLIQAAVQAAARRGFTRCFALTRRPNLFVRLGFRIVPKTMFPEKVWTDCRACPRREHCDETAVLLALPAEAAESRPHSP